MAKEIVYLKFYQDNLQVFFAVLAFLERYRSNYLFIIDNQNYNILTECLRIIKFEFIIYDVNSGSKFKNVVIKINHKNPNTEIENFYKSYLVFPKLLKKNHFKNFNEKYDIIYFRGLLTISRALEMVIALFKINDFKALMLLIINLLMNKKEFIISTTNVYFKFTKRGRDSKMKYYDLDYYNEMTKYKYVFCPKGDFLWTYRFFETIQLGGIPICNYSHIIYEDFFYVGKKNKFKNIQEVIKSNLLMFSNLYYIN